MFILGEKRRFAAPSPWTPLSLPKEIRSWSTTLRASRESGLGRGPVPRAGFGDGLLGMKPLRQIPHPSFEITARGGTEGEHRAVVCRICIYGLITAGGCDGKRLKFLPKLVLRPPPSRSHFPRPSKQPCATRARRINTVLNGRWGGRGELFSPRVGADGCERWGEGSGNCPRDA